MAKQRQPHGPPMTLGNRRELGVHRLVACCLTIGLALNGAEAGQPEANACSQSIDDLAYGFSDSATIVAGERVRESLPPMARWERREAVIGIFREEPLHPLSTTEALHRNVAVLRAVATLGPSWPFRFSVALGKPQADVELTFATRATKQKISKISQILPRDALPSAIWGGCQVYLHIIDSGEAIGAISKSFIVVADDVTDTELSQCASISLVRSTGLIGW
jgi:hypothetical protein